MEVILLLLLQAAPAPGEAAITAARLKEELVVLASDEYEGRNAGFPGNQKASDYLAGRLKEWGLAPGAADGTYFQPFEFDDGDASRRTRNVLALVPGGDPELGRQLIVLGAHYDHVGLKAQAHAGQVAPAGDGDAIFNGADDNGSGTVTLLGIARALAESKAAPRRSVLLVWFSAEEAGLFGSKHYVEHPIRELSLHAAMINMDMVGRNPEVPVAIGGAGSDRDGALRDALERAIVATGLTASVRGYGDVVNDVSDHHPFYAERIPTLLFFTGFHPDYHRVSDHSDRIAYDRMEQVGRTILRTALDLADRPAPLAFKAPRASGLKLRRLDAEATKALGLAEGRGAVEVRKVLEGSVEEAAGILPDDIVVSAEGRPLPVREAHKVLTDWIESARPGTPHAVGLIRKGEPVKVTLKWDE